MAYRDGYGRQRKASMDKCIYSAMLTVVGFLGAACAGGSGGEANSPARPTVTVSADRYGMAAGEAVTISWSSISTTGCSATGAWSGPLPLSGSNVVRPTATGLQALGVSCSGPGGTTSAQAHVDVARAGTIPVQRSSYEAKHVAGEVLGPLPLPVEVRYGSAVAFADFFQEGAYSVVTHTLVYNPQDPSTANDRGRIHFYRQAVNGAWSDATASLLSETLGCVHPRKAIVADFNGDGRPDVFFACQGFDVAPFPGESPHVLLSQPGGTYSNVTLDFNCFCHSASAADVTGDGLADVVVTDHLVTPQPFFLVNKGDGTFARDLSRLPSSTAYKSIFTAELIDFGHRGRYDLLLAGNEQNLAYNDIYPAAILPNDGSGSFATADAQPIPPLPGFGCGLDVAYDAGNIYLLRTIDDPAHFYEGAAIQKISYPDLVGSAFYANYGPYSTGSRWFNWIIAHRGAIESMDSVYGVSIPE